MSTPLASDPLPALRHARRVLRAANSLKALPLAHWAILLELVSPHTDSVKQCADKTGYERSTIRAAIDALDARGFITITRPPNPNGGHQRIKADLTPTGAQLLKTLAAATTLATSFNA